MVSKCVNASTNPMILSFYSTLDGHKIRLISTELLWSYSSLLHLYGGESNFEFQFLRLLSKAVLVRRSFPPDPPQTSQHSQVDPGSLPSLFYFFLFP
jgi:hypothetical protein